LLVQRPGQQVHVVAAAKGDVEAMASTHHLTGDDAHQVQQQEHATDNDWRPQKAAAMLPQFPLHQPVESFHA